MKTSVLNFFRALGFIAFTTCVGLLTTPQAIFPSAHAFSYVTSLKTTRMNAVVTAIGTSGKLKFYCTDGTTIAATLALSSTAGTVSGAVLTFNSISSGTAGATCTVNSARITTSADADVVTGLTVGTSGQDINLGSVSFSPGLTVSVTSLTLTHP
jgi:hypothetical protein